jgi:hypothetical protein
MPTMDLVRIDGDKLQALSWPRLWASILTTC